MATNFLLAAGTNGFITAPFNLASTELNTLTSGSVALSSVGGTSGKFSQTTTGNAPFGSVYFTMGGTITPTANGRIDGWFILSTDGGTTFEKAVAAPNRVPDFTIPLLNAAYSANDVIWCQGRFVSLPWETFKVLIQNNSGVSLAASGNLVKVGGVATQY